jgi:hypothetical protein
MKTPPTMSMTPKLSVSNAIIYQEAEAAWLTCCSHEVNELGALGRGVIVQ